MTSSWWSVLTPVVLPISCAGEEHEVAWSQGALTAPAHPSIERERALAALGAEPAPCVQIFDAWHRYAEDLDVLVLGSRGTNDPLAAGHHGPPQAGWFASRVLPHRGYAALNQRAMATVVSGPARRRAGWHAIGGSKYAEFDDGGRPAFDLGELLSLGGGLPQRLAATVIATWAQRIEDGDERVAPASPSLEAALYGRVRSAVQSWTGSSAVALNVRMIPANQPASVRRDGEAVVADLPFAWLRDVWAAGMAVVLDRLCLEAAHPDAQTWVLNTIDRDLSTRRTLTVSG